MMRRGRMVLGVALVDVFVVWCAVRADVLTAIATEVPATVGDLVAIGLVGIAWLLLAAGAALIVTSRSTVVQKGAWVSLIGGGLIRGGGAPGGVSGMNRTTRGGSEL